MRLFGKKSAELNAVQQQRTEQVAERILRWQREAAAWLNLRTSRITVRGWVVLLLVFCLGFGGYCLMLVLNAL